MFLSSLVNRQNECLIWKQNKEKRNVFTQWTMKNNKCAFFLTFSLFIFPSKKHRRTRQNFLLNHTTLKINVSFRSFIFVVFHFTGCIIRFCKVWFKAKLIRRLVGIITTIKSLPFVLHIVRQTVHSRLSSNFLGSQNLITQEPIFITVIIIIINKFDNNNTSNCSIDFRTGFEIIKEKVGRLRQETLKSWE